VALRPIERREGTMRFVALRPAQAEERIVEGIFAHASIRANRNAKNKSECYLDVPNEYSFGSSPQCRHRGTTSGLADSGSMITRASSPKTSSTSVSVITSAGAPVATTAPSLIAMMWSAYRAA